MPRYQQRLFDVRTLICGNPLAPDSVAPPPTQFSRSMAAETNSTRPSCTDLFLFFFLLSSTACRVRGKSEYILLPANPNGTLLLNISLVGLAFTVARVNPAGANCL